MENCHQFEKLVEEARIAKRRALERTKTKEKKRGIQLACILHYIYHHQETLRIKGREEIEEKIKKTRKILRKY